MTRPRERCRRFSFFEIGGCQLRRVICSAVLLFSVFGPGSGHAQLAETHSPPGATPGSFIDVTQKLGVHFKHEASPTSRKYLLETMGSGVALFDYDNDGRLDIFFANGARFDDPTPKNTIPKKD